MIFSGNKYVVVGFEQLFSRGLLRIDHDAAVMRKAVLQTARQTFQHRDMGNITTVGGDKYNQIIFLDLITTGEGIIPFLKRFKKEGSCFLLISNKLLRIRMPHMQYRNR